MKKIISIMVVIIGICLILFFNVKDSTKALTAIIDYYRGNCQKYLLVFWAKGFDREQFDGY